MLIDVLLAVAAGLIGGLISAVLPGFGWTIPTVDVSWLLTFTTSVNQLVPLDVLYQVLLLAIALRVAMIIFSVCLALWDRMPFVGHAAV